MCLIQFKLPLYQLLHPATQRHVRITEQIGAGRVDHAGNLEALALELLIRRHRVAMKRKQSIESVRWDLALRYHLIETMAR